MMLVTVLGTCPLRAQRSHLQQRLPFGNGVNMLRGNAELQEVERGALNLGYSYTIAVGVFPLVAAEECYQ